MFEMFRRDSGTDADFKFLHVFTKIESCKKWAEVRLALAKAKDGVYNPDAPVLGTVDGRPDDKKGKECEGLGACFRTEHVSIE
ncbi:putative methionyl-tRNA synthetase [Hordeum vulgare]|nr:putative methionyl-tRNA synthetase [Hordeum vulgare]